MVDGTVVTDVETGSGSCRRNFPRGDTDDRLLYWAVFMVATVLIIINITRLFDFNFWGDEVYSILVSRYTTEDIIIYAKDVDSHPPLFNLMLSFVTAIFGQNAFAYHFTPFIAYIGIMVLGLTFVRKNFGSVSAIIFMLLATLLDSSIVFITEVRMYELGAFLVMASYASMYHIMKDGGKIYFVLFVISSLAAAYTHYYCLLAVAFFYVGLFFYYVLRHDWKGFRVYFVAGLVTVIGYLPWLLKSAVQTAEKDTNKFWIPEQPSVRDMLLYFFDCQYSVFFFLLFAIVVVLLFKRNIECRRSNDSPVQKHESEYELVWFISGIVSAVGSILFGVILSMMTTPLIIERYIYPVGVVVWLLFSIGVSRITVNRDHRFFFSLFVVAVILFACTSSLCDTMEEEKEENESTAEIIDITYDYLSPGDTIVTNMNHMRKTLGKFYYPDLNISYIDEDTKIVPPIDDSCNNLLYLTSEVRLIDITDQLSQQGYTAVYLTKGNFGSMYNVVIYELVKIQV